MFQRPLHTLHTHCLLDSPRRPHEAGPYCPRGKGGEGVFSRTQSWECKLEEVRAGWQGFQNLLQTTESPVPVQEAASQKLPEKLPPFLFVNDLISHSAQPEHQNSFIQGFVNGIVNKVFLGTQSFLQIYTT